MTMNEYWWGGGRMEDLKEYNPETVETGGAGGDRISVNHSKGA